MDWMLMPLRKYAQFSGRSQRKEFWMWVVFVILVSIVAAIIDRILGFGRTEVVNTPTFTGAAFQSRGPVQLIVTLALLVPNFAVAVRRLHDIDRTGWWILAPIIPYVIGATLMLSSLISRATSATPASLTAGAAGSLAAGGIFFLIGLILAIVLLVFYCLDGTRGANRFGPDPKGPDLAQTFA